MTFRYVTILLIMLVPVINIAAQTDKYTLVTELMASQQYEEAILKIEELLDEDVANFKAWEMKVNVMVKTDKIKSVLKELDDQIEQNQSVAEFYYLRAVVNMHLQKYTRSLEDFNKSIAFEIAEHYKPKVYLNRGMLYIYLQEYDLAEESFKSTLEISPANATAYHSLGMLFYETGEFENSITYFIKALKLESNNPVTLYNLGMTYLKLEDTENACFYFNKSCELKYNNACKMMFLECSADNK